MAAHHDDEKDLPAVWPFTLAGVLILAALSWFCAGFAIHDMGDELPAFYQVFFSLIAAGGVLIVGATILNLTAESARRKRG
ncbi:MAG: hypothetical protein AB1416_02350 [Actinomycetota bacterium]